MEELKINKATILDILQEHYERRGYSVKIQETNIHFDAYIKLGITEDKSKRFEYDWEKLTVSDLLYEKIITAARQARYTVDFSKSKKEDIVAHIRKLILNLPFESRQILIEVYGLCPETIGGRSDKSRNYGKLNILHKVFVGKKRDHYSSKHATLLDFIRENLISEGFGIKIMKNSK